MTISAVDQTTLASLKATAAAYLKSEVVSGKVATAATTPNPYGSLSGTFTNTAVLDTQDYVSIDASKLSAGQIVTGVPDDGAISITQAFKEATEVDPATGLREINQAGVGALSQALLSYATTGFGASVGPDGTGTNSLSLTDIKNAVADSINAFIAGGGKTDLTLNLTDDYSGVAKSGAANQTTINNETLAESVSSTVNVSISAASGDVTAINDRHIVEVATGIGTREGTADASISNDSTALFGNQFVSGYNPYAINQRLPDGVEVVGSTSEEYSNDSVDTYVAPTTGATTVSNVADSGSFASTYSVDKNGLSLVNPSTTKDEIALAALKSFQHFEESLESGSGTSSTSNIATSSATTKLPTKVTDTDGSTSVLYTRPDGTLAKFSYQGVNTVA